VCRPLPAGLYVILPWRDQQPYLDNGAPGVVEGLAAKAPPRVGHPGGPARWRQGRSYFSLEHAPGHGIKSNLCLITRPDPLQRALLEGCSKAPIFDNGVDELHNQPQRSGNHIHSGPQGDLGDKSGDRRRVTV
jgi:hypothetical protein